MFGWEKDIKKHPTYHYSSFALAWWSPISGKTRSLRFFIGRYYVPIFLLFCYGNVYRLMSWKANSMLGREKISKNIPPTTIDPFHWLGGALFHVKHGLQGYTIGTQGPFDIQLLYYV